MKKIIVGLVIFSLMFTVSAQAEQIETIVGKLVQGVFPVQVDGNKLDKEAIVIDGTTYLPVRAFGEAIGYDVTFDAELGITMSKKIDQERQGEIKRLQDEAKRIQWEGKLQELLTDKEAYEIRIKAFQEDMKTYSDKSIIDKIQVEIDKVKAELEKVNIELNELESLK